MVSQDQLGQIKDYLWDYFEDDHGSPLAESSYEISDMEGVTIYESVRVRTPLPQGHIQVPINVAEKDFDLNSNASSLENCPIIVNGSFYCTNCNLNSLTYAPHHVSGDFNCSFNHLKSLEHAPKHVGGVVRCAHNLLPDLSTAPSCYTLWAVNNPLKTLKCTPSHVVKVCITVTPDLPLLPLLECDNIFELYDANMNRLMDLEKIILPYVNQGKSVVLNCALALKKAGYGDNAKW